jgi:hypothetical protein
MDMRMKRIALTGALVAAALMTTPAGAAACAPAPAVPGAQMQRNSCVADLSSAALTPAGLSVAADWTGLSSAATARGPAGPGLQIDGYFPDTSTTNTNNGWNHDAQFVIRLPNNWNGGLVVSGAPGVRRQYANDVTISDWVVARGYAFASTDKGNTGADFFRDGVLPGDAILEWHQRVTQLALAARAVVTRRYGRVPRRTYMAGQSNGGYLVRWQLEHHPELYNGGVDWEGTLFTADGPNLFTYLPTALAAYPRYVAGDESAHQQMLAAGFAPGSEFLWDFHDKVYWDLTQRIYREELDPTYDGALEAGTPFCTPGSAPGCDADYNYAARPPSVHQAVARVSLTGRIGKPMITLHGTLDTLLPITTDSDVYDAMIRRAGRQSLHAYYTVAEGTHVDALYDTYPDRLRPILPCFRSAFVALERWVDQGKRPPARAVVERPAQGDVVNQCELPGEGQTR